MQIGMNIQRFLGFNGHEPEGTRVLLQRLARPCHRIHIPPQVFSLPTDTI
jgi:hypothetical protein